VTLFIVEKGPRGLTVSRGLDKRGWRSSYTADLVFESCRGPKENILGELKKGFYTIMRSFQNERTVLAAQSIVEAAKALEITLQYVQERKAFGATLWEKQTIRQRLAMLQAKVEAGRQLTYHAAWLASMGQDCVTEVSMAKAFCCELVTETMYACPQFHGGFGYIRESAIERMVRDARVQSIGGGATEVMLEEISKRSIID